MARVKITETVLRDGHQSIAATRMRLRQMLPVLEAMDEVGYNALECWGTAFFKLKRKLRHSLRRPSRSDLVQFKFI